MNSHKLQAARGGPCSPYGITKPPRAALFASALLQYETLAELRAWQLALLVIARIQDQSRFFHFWHGE